MVEPSQSQYKMQRQTANTFNSYQESNIAILPEKRMESVVEPERRNPVVKSESESRHSGVNQVVHSQGQEVFQSNTAPRDSQVHYEQNEEKYSPPSNRVYSVA